MLFSALVWRVEFIPSADIVVTLTHLVACYYYYFWQQRVAAFGSGQLGALPTAGWLRAGGIIRHRSMHKPRRLWHVLSLSLWGMWAKRSRVDDDDDDRVVNVGGVGGCRSKLAFVSNVYNANANALEKCEPIKKGVMQSRCLLRENGKFATFFFNNLH